MGVEIERLVAGYGGKPVLSKIDLSIQNGCLCALLGCNGSGKTTLLRCVNDILRPMGGTVMIQGKHVSKLSRVSIARLVSVVPQVSFTPFSYSCLDMVLMGETARLKTWASPGPGAKRRALDLCEQLGIAHLTSRTFNELSGGERQMVLLTRALFQEAPVMLLDEPNSHLDFRNQHRTMDLVRRIVKGRGVTVLVTLHDPNLTLMYCDEAAILKNGRVLSKGPVESVINERNLRQVYGNRLTIEETTSGFRVVLPKADSAFPGAESAKREGGIFDAL